MAATIKVGIVGYGTIGKRVADALKLQPDMELSGVTARSYNFRIEVANKKGWPIYATEDADLDNLKKNGIDVKGDINDLLQASDIIVDCTPSKVGAEMKKKYYEPAGVKAIFQGGEKETVGQCSFNADANFETARGKEFVRVVSCNTTGLCRLLNTLKKKWHIKKVHANLVRRAADPVDIKKGPINAIVPKLTVPSHHGPDVNTVMDDIEVITLAVAVPTTLMHVHCLEIELNGDAPTTEQVVEQLEKTHRIFMLRGETGVTSTAGVMELVKDLHHQRGDVVDNCIWQKGVHVQNSTLFLFQAIHQESIVVPENIDCIRAMCTEMSPEESMKITNETLGIK
jgi:glyceraldehyde-3-phosphate dehydrogenase (NAD(P))